MSSLGVLQFLLLATHVIALCVSIVVHLYLTRLWIGGRLFSASRHPYTEVETGLRILSLSLSILWLSVLLDAAVFELTPRRYYSHPGIYYLTVLTLTSCIGIALITKLQRRILRIETGKSPAIVHILVRITLAGTLSSNLALLVLLLPPAVLPQTMAILNPDDVLLESLMLLGFAFVILFSLTITISDRWVERYNREPSG